ncbi:MAG: hypothetical protein ACM34N_16780, partial [Ignavibacteria bacterium]
KNILITREIGRVFFLIYLTKISFVEKEKQLIFAEKTKKENLPNFKNPRPSTDSQSYYILKNIVIDSHLQDKQEMSEKTI